MGFFKRFLCESVEQVQQLDEAMASCQFESTSNDCSLIQQLKDRQAQKKEVDAKIKAFTSDEPIVMENFVEPLMQMERNHFQMGMEYRSYHMPGAYNSKLKDSFYHHYGTERFKVIISQMPESTIDAIHNELKSMKNWVTILGDLQQQRDALEKEIEQIKAQLGIE